ncbi:hypothetical protein [Desulfolithobacter sp.]
MIKRKIILLLTITCTVALSTISQATPINGGDWDSEESINQVAGKTVSLSSGPITVGIGRDWDSEEAEVTIPHGQQGHIHPHPNDHITGTGRDWAPEEELETPIRPDTGLLCLVIQDR